VAGRREERVGGEKKRKNTVRNEGRAATGRSKPYLNIREVTFTQALPYPSLSSMKGSGPACPREGSSARYPLREREIGRRKKMRK
jgi:hypothetical protein